MSSWHSGHGTDSLLLITDFSCIGHRWGGGLHIQHGWPVDWVRQLIKIHKHKLPLWVSSVGGLMSQQGQGADLRSCIMSAGHDPGVGTFSLE